MYYEDDSRERYNEWILSHEEEIIERYKESIEYIDDVPDSFIETMYENSMEPDYDRAHDERE